MSILRLNAMFPAIKPLMRRIGRGGSAAWTVRKDTSAAGTVTNSLSRTVTVVRSDDRLALDGKYARILTFGRPGLATSSGVHGKGGDPNPDASGVSEYSGKVSSSVRRLLVSSRRTPFDWLMSPNCIRSSDTPSA